MKLPPNLLQCMEKLQAAGHRVYCVGGCVRDHLLGKRPSDYDLCSDAPPERVLELFGSHAHPTGLAHGTVTLCLGGDSFEITVFRKDGPYGDGRHPEYVDFVKDLKTDLARRDFTVNAMAYRPEEGIVDPFGGREDLKNRCLRAVGEPGLRFTEDGLRILRALRFAAVLDFQIEEKTALALHEKAPLLARVARERIGREFLKLLSGPGAEEQLLAYPEIYRICLPWGGDPRGMLRLPPECRLCWLLLPQKDPEAAVNAAKEALRLSKAESERLHLQLSLAHSLPEEEGLLELLQTREPHELLLALLPGERLWGNCPRRKAARDFLEAIEAHGRSYRLRELQLESQALQALGFQGKALGAVRKQLLLAHCRGEAENRREALLALANTLRERQL